MVELTSLFEIVNAIISVRKNEYQLAYN